MNSRMKFSNDLGINGVVLDIGCGWLQEDHGSIIDSVGIDLNIHRGKIKVEHPIIGDAQELPIKERTIDYINCQALLEHLPNQNVVCSTCQNH